MNNALVKVGMTLAVVGMVLSPVSSFAKSTSIDAKNLVTSGKWSMRGDGSVQNGVVTLAERKNESESAYREISVKGYAGDYVVLAAYTKAERVRENDITGLPVLYGYAMNANGKILAYLQGQDMIRTDAESGEWTVNSGIFLLPKGTTTVRYFLNQAEKKGATKSGDDASFKNASLFVADSKSDASRIRSIFANGVESLR